MTKDYYGTKRVTAWRENRDGQEGYAVKYPDGYTSWSPRDVFEAAYKPVDAMDFSGALIALKGGERVCRRGWNGKGMWLSHVLSIHDIPNGGVNIGQPVYRLTIDCEKDAGPTALPWIGMKTADNKFVPWLASQTDMLAEDWMIVEV